MHTGGVIGAKSADFIRDRGNRKDEDEGCEGCESQLRELATTPRRCLDLECMGAHVAGIAK